MKPSLGAAVVTILAVLAAVQPADAGEALPLGIGGDFVLTDQNGTRRDSRDFRGRPMLVYFGYASCPHSCGMALNTISAALDDLGPDASRVAALFVSVDPDHDTPERLAAFLGNFHPAIVGLTGSGEEIESVRREFRIAATRIEDPGRFERLYEHSTFIYLMGTEGELQSILPPVMPPERIAALLRGRL